MDTRQQLIEAAKSLLWERGFEGMSPRSVLDRSGAGQGSLYHHFAGKQALAAAALDETAGEFCARLERQIDASRPPLERVRDWLKAPRDALRGCRLGRMAAELAIREEPLRRPVARYFARLETLLTAALAEAIAIGDLPRQLHSRDLAAALSAMVQGGYVLARTRNDAAEMQRATRGALALLDAAASAAMARPRLRRDRKSVV
jgi:TetR/AcrR family transcriptional regulator, transcriptional repressor for nem operon